MEEEFYNWFISRIRANEGIVPEWFIGVLHFNPSMMQMALTSGMTDLIILFGADRRPIEPIKARHQDLAIHIMKRMSVEFRTVIAGLKRPEQ